MTVYGWREKEIGMLPIHQHRCNNCNKENSLNIQVNKSYIHIFWIPFIPLAKKVYSVCKYCEKLLAKNEMPPDLQTTAYLIKKKTKTPWWYYTGFILIGFLLLYIINRILLTFIYN